MLETDKLFTLISFYTPGHSTVFKVTATTTANFQERDAEHRAPLMSRVLSPYFLVFFAYDLAALCILLVCLSHSTAYAHSYSTGLLLWLVEFVFKMSGPWRYMAQPPTLPSRSELFKRKFGEGAQIGDKDNHAYSLPWLDISQVMVLVITDWPGRIGESR
jgi:hypothetical protein